MMMIIIVFPTMLDTAAVSTSIEVQSFVCRKDDVSEVGKRLSQQVLCLSCCRADGCFVLLYVGLSWVGLSWVGSGWVSWAVLFNVSLAWKAFAFLGALVLCYYTHIETLSRSFYVPACLVSCLCLFFLRFYLFRTAVLPPGLSRRVCLQQ